uniref:Uncharacterized protein n=1 Tax=Anopheles christyi TaxID=43041 RepID=A0A182KEP1_9DIPT
MFSKVIFVALLAFAATSAKPLVPLAYTSAASPFVAAPAVATVASPYLAPYAAAPAALAAYTTPYAAAYTAGFPYAATLPYAAAPYTSLVL